jgi:hypothetical protein
LKRKNKQDLSWDEYIRWIWIPQETFEVKRLGAKSKSDKIWGRKRKRKAGMREPREIKQTFFHVYDAMKSMQSNWPPTFRWRERERERDNSRDHIVNLSFEGLRDSLVCFTSWFNYILKFFWICFCFLLFRLILKINFIK